MITRLAVTLSTLAALLVVGLLTRSALGENLGQRIFEQFGFAPLDGLTFGAPRIVASALLTASGGAFWSAVFAIALLSGYIEWRWGHIAALVSFWGSHIFTLLVSAAPMASIAWFDAHLARLLLTVRDVGPSAGYVGCLGWIVARQPLRFRVPLLVAASAFLGVALAQSLAQLPVSALEVSAALSHAIALPAGVLLAFALTSPTIQLQHARARAEERF